MLAAALLLVAASVPGGGDVIQVRRGLPWAGAMLVKGGPVRVVFFGGSITESAGYRPLVEAGLRARFPAADWEFSNAGVSSTGSTTGVFRFRRDAALAGGRPTGGATVVVVDAAVNDDQDERLAAENAGWGVEGIARMSRHGPGGGVGSGFGGPEVLLVHFPNPSIVEALRAGDAPVSVAAHERVAEAYDLLSVNVAAEVARRIDAGSLTWEEYGGTHPGPAGHRLAAELILEAFAESVDPATRGDRARFVRRRHRLRRRGKLPSVPLRADAVDRADLLEPGNLGGGVDLGDGWTIGTPDWPALPGRCRARFLGVTLLHTTEPGATLTVPPAFTALGLYVLAGPDAGAVEVAVPGEEPRTVELYHDPFSAGLHYPRTVLLYRSSTPPAGPVVVTTKAGERGGTAVRVLGVGVGARGPGG